MDIPPLEDESNPSLWPLSQPPESIIFIAINCLDYNEWGITQDNKWFLFGLGKKFCCKNITTYILIKSNYNNTHVCYKYYACGLRIQ